MDSAGPPGDHGPVQADVLRGHRRRSFEAAATVVDRITPGRRVEEPRQGESEKIGEKGSRCSVLAASGARIRLTSQQ